MKRPVLSLLLIPTLLASCAGPPNYAGSEAFGADPRYRRDFPVAAVALCDAARRALLSEGYVVTRTDGQSLVAGKEFQGESSRHAQLNLYLSCDQRSGGSTLFVAATEEHFDVQSSRQSSSIGFPMIAPIYFGTRSETDSQVKVRGETIAERAFYDRFYRAVQRELPSPP